MNGPSTFGRRIDVREHLARTRAGLLWLLGDLAPDDWARATAAAPWTVRDIAAHVLGDDLSRLSRSRDAHGGDGPRPGETLPAFIHRINDEWVGAAARISPAVIVALLTTTTREVLAFWSTVDLDEIGEPVTWAGPDPAPVWLDCARDFTEYWVHQEQIREATGRRPSDDPGELHAVLDTFLRAVPHTLAGHPATEGAGLTVRVDGRGGGRWTWHVDGGVWRPADGASGRETEIGFDDAATLWRLCTRMLTPDEAARRVEVTGDGELAVGFLQIVSIIR